MYDIGRSLKGQRKQTSTVGRRVLWGGLTFALGVAMLLGHVTESQAVPIDPALNISGSVSFDAVNSEVPTGGASQTGALSRILGGVTVASAIDGVTVTGNNPLSSTPLTDIDDGFRLQFLINGTDGQSNTVFGGNYALSLSNTSATDTFTITLQIAVEHSINASDDDAFSKGKFSLQNAANNDELFFSDLVTDTVNGNLKNGQVLPDFGGTVTDNVLSFLNITLAPNTTFNLQATQDLTGGAVAGSYGGGLLTQLTISAITNDTTPAVVPEPGSLMLMGTGLVGLLFGFKRLRLGGRACNG